MKYFTVIYKLYVCTVSFFSMAKASYFIIMQQFIFQFNQKKNILFGKQNLQQFKLTWLNCKKIGKKIKNDKTMDYCDVIVHQMASYIMNFILLTFQLNCNEDLLRLLICENSPSCMNRVKPLGKFIKFQINTISLSKVMTFFVCVGDDSSPPSSQGQMGKRYFTGIFLIDHLQKVESYYL